MVSIQGIDALNPVFLNSCSNVVKKGGFILDSRKHRIINHEKDLHIIFCNFCNYFRTR
jgi:hypothetical protein